MSDGLRAGRLTARGEGALAVFRIRGPAAASFLARIFEPRGGAALSPEQLRVGRLRDGAATLDEAVVRIAEKPDGWEAEVATHGGLFVVDRLQALLDAAGASLLAEHEAWPSSGAPCASLDDRIASEAREGLLAASAPLQVSFFLEALSGGLGREVHALERSIAARGPAEALVARLDALAGRAAFGLAMSRPPFVLLAGAPNSGKSTLFNALLGEARAIVSAEPGTTRDLVAEPFTCRGFPMRLSDSAGIRASEDAIERLGVARSREALAAADIVVVLVDPAGDIGAQAAFAGSIEPLARRVAVLAKADQPAAAVLRDDARLAAIGAEPVSALTGEGIAGLEARIVHASPFGGVAAVRQAAPFVARHVEALAACREALVRGAHAPAAEALALLRTGERP